MQFSPATIEPIIIDPLRSFFHSYGQEHAVYWDKDEKKTKIQIAAQFDANRQESEMKPRILVNRGGFVIDKVGLSDNLAEAPSNTEKRDGMKGLDMRRNMIMYRGQCSIVIEARNRGVVELLTDMTIHFLAWTRPYLCQALGFKDFVLPMQVSDCTQSREDADKHVVTIALPYIREEHWRVEEQGITLKGFFIDLESRIPDLMPDLTS